MADYGNLKALGHFHNDNVTILFLRSHRQDGQEVRIMDALKNATCLLVVGVDDGRRQGSFEGVPFYTAVERNTVPHHIRQSGKTWLHVYDPKTREPLNGGALREHEARVQREAFQALNDEYEAAE